jgi:L-seryl-tRNA(Ser) seleniumtransferase
MENLFRNLPSISQLLDSPQLKQLVENLNHHVVVDGARSVLEEIRQQIATAKEEIQIPTPGELAEKISDWLKEEEKPQLCPVINATGTILHTGLGRAPLAQKARDAIYQITRNYASVELDLSTGGRGQRAKVVEKLLRELTGAEAAVIVNNNAAATMLALAALAGGREVLISRGELIEIGGSYRLPDVMTCSGVQLKEIGTTNKTHLSDYQRALQAESHQIGAILKVHPSNFEIVGFTQAVSAAELAPVAARHGIPLIDDVGSGALIDFSKYGLMKEPVVSHSIKAGSDVVLFSGDKLLGGPQCGIIVGKRKYIDQIIRHPLTRAMRVDKITLAGLQETLRLYRNPDTLEQELPVLRMLSMPLANLQMRANKIVQLIGYLPGIGKCEVIEEQSMLGGGSLPTQKIPTFCVQISPDRYSVETLAEKIRRGNPPIVGRIFKDKLLLDLRTVAPDQDLDLIGVFEEISRQSGPASDPSPTAETTASRDAN